MSKGKVFFLVLAVALLVFVQAVRAYALAPDFLMTDLDGNTFTLSSFRGKVVLLEFFATWCHACQVDVAELRAVYDYFGSSLVMISEDFYSETNEELRSFKDTYGVTWIVATDAEDAYHKYQQATGNGNGVPAFYIIDQAGYIRFFHLGGADSSTLVAEIEGLITTVRSSADINGDGIVNIKDVAIVSLAYGCSPGDKNWNAAADLDKNGTVNILDVCMVTKDYGKTV